MNKALIEKAFEKWIESKKDKILVNTYDYEVNTNCEDVPYTYIRDEFLDAVVFGATWQREQLEERIKELEDTIAKMQYVIGGISK